jgi:hypothetical protein
VESRLSREAPASSQCHALDGKHDRPFGRQILVGSEVPVFLVAGLRSEGSEVPGSVPRFRVAFRGAGVPAYGICSGAAASARTAEPGTGPNLELRNATRNPGTLGTPEPVLDGF